MNTLNIGDSGSDVEYLCELLKIDIKNKYDIELKNKVIEFQKENNLVADGIVGFKTWLRLFLNSRNTTSNDIQYSDYIWASKLFDCESEALMAVVKVETGGKGGFVANGKPTILFEGHIFWKQLKNRGIDPNKYASEHKTILYPKWVKSYYKGGIAEYDRLNEAIEINREAALESVSMGMFQLMGFNYLNCGCNDVEDMWFRMCKSEVEQFGLGLEFLRIGGFTPYLKSKDWTAFAKRYNGPEYYKNQYDKKLKIAYESYK